MRVIQAMAGGAHGGAEAFFDRLLPALARAGVQQRALVRPEAGRLEGLAEAGIEAVTLRFGGPLDAVSRWRFAREVRRYEPDVVLTWMRRASAACPKGPFVHAGRLGGYYKLSSFRRCDHLIGNTLDLCDYMVRGGWPAERVHYLPNFVSERHVPPVPRARHRTPDDAPLLLALGRYHRNKGFDVLLHALAQVPGAHLWLVGEGEERPRLEMLCADLGLVERVRLIGWQRDPAPYYAAADLVVCPSRYEPLGNVVIEAWAQGRPVVAAAAAGPAGLIEDGRNGLLAPVDDADAMAITLRRLIAAPAEARQLAEGGRAAYLAGFTEAAVVARYLDLLQAITRSRAIP